MYTIQCGRFQQYRLRRASPGDGASLQRVAWRAPGERQGAWEADWPRCSTEESGMERLIRTLGNTAARSRIVPYDRRGDPTTVESTAETLIGIVASCPRNRSAETPRPLYEVGLAVNDGPKQKQSVMIAIPAIDGPFATITLSAGHRTGPAIVSWCVGLPAPTASFNPGCQAPDGGSYLGSSSGTPGPSVFTPLKNVWFVTRRRRTSLAGR
jgi:hypothetical protein